jgi:hypothetical protein
MRACLGSGSLTYQASLQGLGNLRTHVMHVSAMARDSAGQGTQLTAITFLGYYEVHMICSSPSQGCIGNLAGLPGSQETSREEAWGFVDLVHSRPDLVF